MIYRPPQWRIEFKARVHDKQGRPVETWVALRGQGRRYTFVEQQDAEQVKAQLARVQPHNDYRVAPI